MKKIILFILILTSASFAEGIVPVMENGDNWVVRREISGIDDIEDKNLRIQYWKYEVINKFEFNKEEYIVIFASSKEASGNFKLVVKENDFILKEISYKDKNKVTLIEMTEVKAPVIDNNIFARLYDLPAFPLIDPNSATENVDFLPNGKKRIKKSFRRHYLSRGEVGSSELIWQETDNISRKDIISYSRKQEDYINKIKNDGYLLQLKGEKNQNTQITRKIKQIWIESVPWWIYNESITERDYLVDYHSIVKK